MISEIFVYIIFVLSVGITAIVTIKALKEYNADKARRFAEGDFAKVIRKSEIFYFVSPFLAIWAALFEVAAFAFKDTPAAGIPIAVVFFVAEIASVFLLRNIINWKIELEEDSLTHTDLFGRQNIYAYADLTRRPWFGGYRYYARGKFVFGVGFVRGGLVFLNKIMESEGERLLSVAVKSVEEDPATIYARELSFERAWLKSATANDKSLITGLVAEVNATGTVRAEYLADILKAKPTEERILKLIADRIPELDDKNMQAKLVEASAVKANFVAVPAIIKAYRGLNDEQVFLYGASYDKALAAIGDEEYTREYGELISTESGAAIFAELMQSLAKRNAPGIKERLIERLETYLDGGASGSYADTAAANILRALALTGYDEEVKRLMERASMRAPSPEVCALAEELCFAYKQI